MWARGTTKARFRAVRFSWWGVAGWSATEVFPLGTSERSYVLAHQTVR